MSLGKQDIVARGLPYLLVNECDHFRQLVFWQAVTMRAAHQSFGLSALRRTSSCTGLQSIWCILIHHRGEPRLPGATALEYQTIYRSALPPGSGISPGTKPVLTSLGYTRWETCRRAPVWRRGLPQESPRQIWLHRKSSNAVWVSRSLWRSKTLSPMDRSQDLPTRR